MDIDRYEYCITTAAAHAADQNCGIQYAHEELEN